jgi:hypothetical protein
LSAINASNISSGTIANARTTAASANGASTIVLRDASGDFAADIATLNGITVGTINSSFDTSVLFVDATNNRVGINNGTPAASFHAVAPSTTAESLTWNASAGQILRNENSELAIGLSSSSPFNMYIQGRQNSNVARDIIIQPLGGNVGIGTTAPQFKLDLTYGDVTGPAMVISGGRTSGGAPEILFKNSFWAAGNYGYVSITAEDNGAAGGNLIFKTSASGGGSTGVPTERMRIDSSGNVGIGNSSPVSKLDVTGIARFSSVAFSAPSGGKGLEVWYQSDSDKGFIGSFDRASTTYKPLQFFGSQLEFNTGGTERMRIDSSGNVGIGTTSPSFRLQLGTNSSASTATPETLSLGGTFSSTAGANGKIRVWTDGTQYMGFGVSSNQLDYIATGAYNHVWYINGSERMRLSGGFSVGTTSDPGTGAIYATGNITAFFSDQRLKTISGKIENALDKVNSLSGVYYTMNDVAKSHGYDSDEIQVGVLAQEVEAVLPEIVKPAPFDLDENNNSKSGENYKTVQYEKLVPLLIEAIKELKAEIDALKGK